MKEEAFSGNVSAKSGMEFGNVEQGFREADYAREDRFVTQIIQHCSMEPHVSVATFDPAGKVTLWTSTQAPFLMRPAFAKLLDIPLADIRIMSRSATIMLDGGAYASNGAAAVFLTTMFLTLPYKTPNIKFQSYRYYTNKAPGGAMRGYGVPQVQLASEIQMDTVRMVREAGGEMVSLEPLDLADAAQVQKLVELTDKTYGRLDVLYNNASAASKVCTSCRRGKMHRQH